MAMEAGPGWVFTAEELEALPLAELVELVMSQASMIELLMARVERLESEASRDSANSSKPPAADTQKRRAQRRRPSPKGPAGGGASSPEAKDIVWPRSPIPM